MYKASIVNSLVTELNIDPNCSNFEELPDIKIYLYAQKGYKDKNIDIKEITLRPDDYIVNGNRIKQSFKQINDFKENCKLAFMPVDVPKPKGPLFIFGEYFLKKFYCVFDWEEMVVGIADANQYQSFEDKSIVTPYEEVTSNNNNIDSTIQEIVFHKGDSVLSRDDYLLINP
jgi:hypothetical protein